MAGAISQRYDPVANYDPAAKGTFEVPTLLRQAAEVVPPSRDLTFFISHLGAAEQARALGAPREYLGCGQGASDTTYASSSGRIGTLSPGTHSGGQGLHR